MFIVYYIVHYFSREGRAGINFFSQRELLSAICSGKSFIRFGDGETFIMNGGSLPWQKYETGLEIGMRKILQEYNEQSPYIVGLSRFANFSNTELKKDGKFEVWLPVKVMFTLICPKNMEYGDAHVFYYDNFFKDYLEDYLLDKYLIIVTHMDSINSIKNNVDIPFKKILFVTTPKINSYTEYGNIKEKINQHLQDIPPNEIPVLIIGTGPTSKCLAYEYSQKGIPSYDIGRGLEVIYKNESLETIYPELTQNKEK